MGSTLTSIDATLKEVYEGSVREQLNDDIVGLKRVLRSSDGVSNETPGKYVTFDQLKQGRKDEVLASMLTLYDVSKLRGA